ncbi:MAG: hypothetical protein H6654_18095 [Ardenticatenaceae bacterium]|nr:hypothetical protein [Anaerolineales bacterium]MCB8937330.1 hypothetical protein [Ardenticatenaceae bacterium]MCB8975476.1 hypothetical protein [Ardenticatenaceae bacterium]
MTIDYLTFSNFIIDDIIFPDGQTSMNTMGGSGLHALVGIRLWSDKVGYAAAVGEDLSSQHQQALERFGLDLTGLIVRPGFKTPRSWLVMEWNGRRTEVSRTELADFRRMRVMPQDLPPSYRQARGFHLNWGTLPEARDLCIELRRTNPNITIVYELATSNMGEPVEEIQRLLPYLTLFSPNIDEALTLTGLPANTKPETICDILLEWGAPQVALRMGAEGSLVKAQNGEGYRLPAVPTEIIDETGAGNSYCGGILTGLGDGLSLPEAALRGAVSASFALEQHGLPNWTEMPKKEANQRLIWAKERLEKI